MVTVLHKHSKKVVTYQILTMRSKLATCAQRVRDDPCSQLWNFFLNAFDLMGEIIHRYRVQSGDSDEARIAPICIADGLTAFVELRDGRLGCWQKVVPGLCELNGVGGAVDQGQPNPVFQGFDPTTEGRLGDVALVRCSGEI